MNPYYNESAFLQDLAILVNTDSGTGTVEGIDKIANFMMKKYADLGMSSSDRPHGYGVSSGDGG